MSITPIVFLEQPSGQPIFFLMTVFIRYVYLNPACVCVAVFPTNIDFHLSVYLKSITSSVEFENTLLDIEQVGAKPGIS